MHENVALILHYLPECEFTAVAKCTWAASKYSGKNYVFEYCEHRTHKRFKIKDRLVPIVVWRLWQNFGLRCCRCDVKIWSEHAV